MSSCDLFEAKVPTLQNLYRYIAVKTFPTSVVYESIIYKLSYNKDKRTEGPGKTKINEILNCSKRSPKKADEIIQIITKG